MKNYFSNIMVKNRFRQYHTNEGPITLYLTCYLQLLSSTIIVCHDL